MDMDGEQVQTINELEALRLQNAAYEAENEELRNILGDDYIQYDSDIDVQVILSDSDTGDNRGFELEETPSLTRRQRVAQALECNLMLQERVKRLLKAVENSRDAYETVRARVLALYERKKATAVAPHSIVSNSHDEYTGKSWFWSLRDSKGIPKYNNIGSFIYVAQHLPLVNRSGGWSKDEKTKLEAGVIEVAKERMVDDMVTQMTITIEDFTELQMPLRNLKVDSQEVLDLADDFSDQDWSKLAARHLPGRSGIACKLQWKNSVDPRINTESFSEVEKVKLEALVGTYGDRAWDTISQKIEGRTPLACLSEYEKMRNSRQQTSKEHEISAGDLKKLNSLVLEYGQAWKRIEDELQGPFTADQLMHIWRKDYQRTRGGEVKPRKGPWNKKEDSMLLKGVAICGKNWTKVAIHVPGRTDVQCRERYLHALDPTIKIAIKFSPEEEAILSSKMKEYLQNVSRIPWSKIAKSLPGRTDRQCRKAWEKMERHRKKNERKKPKR